MPRRAGDDRRVGGGPASGGRDAGHASAGRASATSAAPSSSATRMPGSAGPDGPGAARAARPPAGPRRSRSAARAAQVLVVQAVVAARRPRARRRPRPRRRERARRRWRASAAPTSVLVVEEQRLGVEDLAPSRPARPAPARAPPAGRRPRAASAARRAARSSAGRPGGLARRGRGAPPGRPRRAHRRARGRPARRPARRPAGARRGRRRRRRRRGRGTAPSAAPLAHDGRHRLEGRRRVGAAGLDPHPVALAARRAWRGRSGCGPGRAPGPWSGCSRRTSASRSATARTTAAAGRAWRPCAPPTVDLDAAPVARVVGRWRAPARRPVPARAQVGHACRPARCAPRRPPPPATPPARAAAAAATAPSTRGASHSSTPLALLVRQQVERGLGAQHGRAQVHQHQRAVPRRAARSMASITRTASVPSAPGLVEAAGRLDRDLVARPSPARARPRPRPARALWETMTMPTIGAARAVSRARRRGAAAPPGGPRARPVAWEICQRQVSESHTDSSAPDSRTWRKTGSPTAIAMSYFSTLQAVRPGDAAADRVHLARLAGPGPGAIRPRAGVPMPWPRCWQGAW